MPIEGLKEAYKAKSYKFGNIYLSDLFNSMFLIVIEFPNSPDLLSKTFFYTDSTKKLQRTSANRAYRDLRQLLSQGNYKAIEEMIT